MGLDLFERLIMTCVLVFVSLFAFGILQTVFTRGGTKPDSMMNEQYAKACESGRTLGAVERLASSLNAMAMTTVSVPKQCTL